VTPLHTLWLPVVLSSVFVFIVSAAIHMLPLWHRKDYPKVPEEQRVREALGPLAIPPGEYMVPRASGTREMRSPEFLEKVKNGPVVILTVRPNNMPGMAKNLIQWFVYSLVVGLFAAYVAGRALPPGSVYLHVFRFAGAVSFLAYSLALWQMSIWYARSWKMTIKETIDGLVYALVTAGVFGWLWPR
jgi:hypothetical protein